MSSKVDAFAELELDGHVKSDDPRSPERALKRARALEREFYRARRLAREAAKVSPARYPELVQAMVAIARLL